MPSVGSQPLLGIVAILQLSLDTPALSQDYAGAVMPQLVRGGSITSEKGQEVVVVFNLSPAVGIVPPFTALLPLFPAARREQK